MDELLDVRVLGHHALKDLALSLVPELAPAEFQLGQGEKAVVAVQVLVLRVGRDVVQQLVVAAEGNAAVQGLERASAAADVRQVDVDGLAVHCLERVYVHSAVAGVYVYQHLCRVADAGHCLKRVTPAYDREIGHSVQLIEVGTGDAEEIAHHLVRVPGDLKL